MEGALHFREGCVCNVVYCVTFVLGVSEDAVRSWKAAGTKSRIYRVMVGSQCRGTCMQYKDPKSVRSSHSLDAGSLRKADLDSILCMFRTLV